MTKAAFAQADTGGSLTAVRRDLSETSQELENLRVALDAKLATLEAAFASADPSDSLETLVIDLARTATAEAEAAALRACLESSWSAQEQVEAIRVEAEQSVETERTTVAAVHAHLEDLEATPQAERETARLLRRELEEQTRGARRGREAGGALQWNLEEAEQRISAVESAKEVEVCRPRAVDEQARSAARRREELERVLEKPGPISATRETRSTRDSPIRPRTEPRGGGTRDGADRDREHRKRSRRLRQLSAIATRSPRNWKLRVRSPRRV
jgi:hypothetical protein